MVTNNYNQFFVDEKNCELTTDPVYKTSRSEVRANYREAAEYFPIICGPLNRTPFVSSERDLQQGAMSRQANVPEGPGHGNAPVCDLQH